MSAGALAHRPLAVVFDMDGVLVNSAPIHRDAFVAVLARAGIHTFDYSRYAGWKTIDVMRDVYREDGRVKDEETLQELAAAKSRLARELMQDSYPLARGCATLLSRLATGYRLGLASSGSGESVEAFFRASRTRRLFDSVLSGEDVKRAKPDPEIYARSFANLGLAAAQCLVVEDAVAGVQAARMAGAKVAGLAGTSPPEALQAAGACLVMEELSQLSELLMGPPR